MSQRAEVAGAGLGGLATAIGLARAGWRVRVHERAPEVREVGAGIFLAPNGLSVLEEYGLLSRIAERGVLLEQAYMLNGRGKILQDRRMVETGRRWVIPRQDLLMTLRDAAVELGVEILLNSRVDGARADGSLLLASGEVVRADLVVGADGHLSRVRNSLGLTKREGPLRTTSVRYLLPHRLLAPENATKQYWSGRRRMAITSASPTATYVYLSCPVGDPAEGQRAGWEQAWLKAFPARADVLHELPKHKPYVASYVLALTHSWICGKVALIGDAAHALPPTLGQGANLAFSNSRSLVTYLSASTSVEQALERWQTAVRPTSDHTQRWSVLYDRATTRWPEPLAPLRNGIVWAFGAIPSINRHMRKAERTPAVTGLALKS